MIASALTCAGPVPAIVLFWRDLQPGDARVVYEQRGYAMPADALWRGARARFEGGRVRARDEGALLSLEWKMPEPLARVAGQATLLTLTFEAEREGSWLTLTHAGFGRGPEWDEALAWHRRFWPAVLDGLEAG